MEGYHVMKTHPQLQHAVPMLVLSLALSCATAVAQPVRMAQDTPYADDAEIPQKVRSECVKLGAQLPAYAREFGAESGVDIELVEDGWRCVLVPTKAIKYRVTLVVASPDGEIADATLELPPLVDDEEEALVSVMPFSMPAADEYISLWPMIWPLPAFSTKYGSPALDSRRSKRSGRAALVRTDSMPPSAAAWLA